jgi:hypothetical protein
MKILEAVREMPLRDAVGIFARYGILNADTLDEKRLKAARMALAKRFHSDTGSSTDEMSNINAAYDALKKGNTGGGYEDHTSPKPQPHYTKNPEDWRDLRNIENFFKQNAKPGAKKWGVENWDGHFFRQSFSVMATKEDFAEMAKKLQQWGAFFDIKTIFAVEVGTYEYLREAKQYLIWHDGKTYSAENAPIYDPDDYATFGSQTDYRFPDRFNAWIKSVTGNSDAKPTPVSSDWRVFGFNGQFFNDGAKFQGNDSLLMEAAKRAKAHFSGTGFDIAIWAQDRTLNPTKLRLIYFANHYYTPETTPSIDYEWGADEDDARPGAAKKFCDRAREILIREKKQKMRYSPH